MFQFHSPVRLIRTLVAAGALCFCAVAHSAMPVVSRSASPFGVDALGHFEPTTPLDGAGWQLLAANTKHVADMPVAVSAPPVIPAPATDISAAAVPATGVTAVAATSKATPATPMTPTSWTVSPVDANFRQLIEGWAPRAGWRAAPWELDKDVPIVGSDVFEGDFKSAVRRVLSSTEMTDYIIKPCFYSNNVVRVVKQTTKCDLSK
ncbi:toxin co-regulated pilus biosynthesis Q family protein [Cupriavidus pinatubonensis]|uniref:toxin co-regulated pilus biosynthesis Q family protein n=1 Tax=Cupriavidus pinatubonensis TaxID=248026 RepID=UPI003615B584